jgi:hypothetical protein
MGGASSTEPRPKVARSSNSDHIPREDCINKGEALTRMDVLKFVFGRMGDFENRWLNLDMESDRCSERNGQMLALCAVIVT